MNRNTKRLIAIGTPFAAVAATGVAFAAWTTTATGNGYGHGHTLSASLTSIDSGNVVKASGYSNDLEPGYNGDLVFVVNNSANRSALAVSSVATTATPGCGVTLNSTAITAWLATAPIAASSASTTFVVPNGVSMDSSTLAMANTCQGADIPLALSVGLHN